MAEKNLTEVPLFIVPENDSDLIDRIASLNDQIKPLEAEVAFLKEAAKSRLSPGEHKGIHYQCVLTQRTRSALDTTAIKEAMGEDWCAQYTKVSEFTEIRFKKLDA